MENVSLPAVAELIKRTQDTLESLGKQFDSLCPKCLHFKMGQCMSSLLQHQFLLENEEETINCLFLLCYITQPQELNPFNRTIFNYVNQHPADRRVLSAAYFISLLPFSQQTLHSTAAQIVQNVKVVSQPLKNFPYTPKADSGLPIILDDPENDSREESHYKEVLSQLFDDGLTERVFVPPFSRLPPPLHPSEEELIWMWPNDLPYHFHLDSNISQAQDKKDDFRKLFLLAQKQALMQPQLEEVKRELQGREDALQRLPISPTSLPRLVEHNPALAVEVLLILAQGQQFGEYLTALINMELSLPALEVVNKVTASLELPPQFIQFYIRNCITSCTDIPDRNTQHRFVRLVCVFLTSLIRNRLVNVQEILIEIQAFCIEHSRIREATGLFRLLKSLDNKEPS